MTLIFALEGALLSDVQVHDLKQKMGELLSVNIVSCDVFGEGAEMISDFNMSSLNCLRNLLQDDSALILDCQRILLTTRSEA